MRRVSIWRFLIIIAVIGISAYSLTFQNIDVRALGSRFERGSDAILGMRLGLDLQGGSHLVYQARGSKELTITFEETVSDLEAVNAVFNDIGKTEASVRQGDEDNVAIVRVNTINPAILDAQGNVVKEDDQDIIRNALGEQIAPVETMTIQDIVANPTTDQMDGVLDTIARRINPFGVTEPVIQLMDNNRILVQLPGVRDVEEVKKLIGSTARLEFKERNCLQVTGLTLPSGEVAYPCELPDNHVDQETGLTGEDLARAYAGTHQTKGTPIVNVQFNSRGQRIFADLTTRLAGTNNRFAVFLDEDEIVAPVVNQPILAGAAFIEGPTFTPERVHTIAIQLESGRLPIPIEVVQEQDVDAVLGAESLRKSLIAGIVGLCLVLLFMVMYYRMAGLVAAVALLIYTAAVISVFKMVPITLTLAGVAAFILSIGMAVDANILIFERMKEELRLGRTLTSAIDIGFSRAWTSIRDGNVSTLIICAILFWFGQRLGASLIAGFALTLGIGVTLSMFSALTVSKTLLNLLNFSPLGRRRGIFSPERLPKARTASAGATEEGGDS